MQNGVTKVGQEIDGVTRAATSNLAHCDEVIEELAHLAKGVDLSSSHLKNADERVAKLLETSEGLIALIADSGVETSDAPLDPHRRHNGEGRSPRPSRRASRAARSRSSN